MTARDDADAVDARTGFVDAVIAAPDRRRELVVLIYTPDHAENLLEDRRAIRDRSRRHPTRRNTRVPAVFRTNAAWRSTHASRWTALRDAVATPLMLHGH